MGVDQARDKVATGTVDPPEARRQPCRTKSPDELDLPVADDHGSRAPNFALADVDDMDVGDREIRGARSSRHCDQSEDQQPPARSEWL